VLPDGEIARRCAGGRPTGSRGTVRGLMLNAWLVQEGLCNGSAEPNADLQAGPC
jgi:hypothetical protein